MNKIEKESEKRIVKGVYSNAKHIYFHDIEIYDSNNKWAQGKYLVHGNEGSYWVETIKEVLNIIKQDLESIEKEYVECPRCHGEGRIEKTEPKKSKKGENKMEKKIIITVKGKRFSGRTTILNKISKFLQNEGFEIKNGMHHSYYTKIQEDDREHSIVIINKFKS